MFYIYDCHCYLGNEPLLIPHFCISEDVPHPLGEAPHDVWAAAGLGQYYSVVLLEK